MAEAAIEQTVRTKSERKQITVAFIDIVGFSTVASRVDPEDLQDWLGSFYASCERIVSDHGGQVTEYLGDGIVALFGLSQANELTAPQAVQASVKIQSEVDFRTPSGSPTMLRVGIATGEAVIKADGTRHYLPRATGMVTTLAKRVQEQALPGAILVSETTKVLLRDAFATEALPLRLLKGFETELALFRVHPRTVRRSEVARQLVVGRDAEILAIENAAGPCLVTGPAGIGKSALVQRIASTSDAFTAVVADGVNTKSSYRPFVNWLRRRIQSDGISYNALIQTFPTLSTRQHQALALVLALPEGQTLVASVNNLALKSLIEASLWAAFQSHQPKGLILVEDLHWLDNASFGVIVHMLQAADPTLHKIVLTSRDDPKINRHLGTLDLRSVVLKPLDTLAAAQMLASLTGPSGNAPEMQKLVDTAEGIPLFLEQLFQHSRMTGTTDRVPGSLMDLLAHQIDATGAAKPVLQCAAAIGYGFSIELLDALVEDRTTLAQDLILCCDAGVLIQTGPKSWRFAHALLHQAAYGGMLRQTRRSYHAVIADHILDTQPDILTRDPAMLANHLAAATRFEPAIQAYLAASQAALFQGALTDAEAHVLTALTVCDEASQDMDVTALEIACHTALGSIRMQVQGFTAPPVRAAFETVGRLAATQSTFAAANGPAFYGSFTHAILSGDAAASARFSDLLRAAAHEVPTQEVGQTLKLASLNVDAALHFYRGDFSQVSDCHEQLREIYDIAQHGAMIAQYGADPYAATQMFDSVGQAIMGEQHLIAEMIATTDAHQDLLNIPVMHPWAQIWGAVALFYAGQTDAAQARVANGLDIAIKQGAAFWQVTGAAWQFVITPELAQTPQGLANFRQVIETHEQIGAHVGLPYFRVHYALALLQAGQHDAAMSQASQALQTSTDSHLLCWQAEIQRLFGQICRTTANATQAKQLQLQAEATAKTQGARLWGLRAALDLVAAGDAEPTRLVHHLDTFGNQIILPEVSRAKTLLLQT